MDRIALMLARAAAMVLFAYVFLRLQGVADAHAWPLLGTRWGAWWLLEVLGFVLVPSLMFAYGSRNRDVGVVRVAAVIAVAGVVLNRVNVSIIAFNWKHPFEYVPSWMEIVGSITIVTMGVMTFRWIVNRMPVIGLQGALDKASR
jgi:Ni/Fe-hydrogenase subunit HybB-like protein